MCCAEQSYCLIIIRILLFAENDKLLKPEYPKVSYHCISETDSQEKTLLWKLRTSATKLSSQARVVKADVSISGGQGTVQERS